MMSFQIKKGVLFLLTVIFSGCSDSVLDRIDTNPNAPTDVPISQLLPNITMSAVYSITGGHTAMGISTYVEHTSNVHLERLDPDIVEATIWNSAYPALNNIQILLNKAEQEQSPFYAGIGKVLLVYILSVTTDVYGDIPLSEALQGSGVRAPGFDSQETVYNYIFDTIDSAINDLNHDSGVSIRNADLIFNGNIDMWKKTAYGLKARLWNRLSGLYPEKSAQEVLQALPFAFTAGESFSFSRYQEGTVNDNPWTGQQKVQQNHAVSKTLIDVMNGYTIEPYSDPRMEMWFSKINGSFVGAPANNTTTDPAHIIFSAPSRENVLYDKAPQPILTYSELKFIEAEAFWRLGNRTKSNEAYEEAVKSALAERNISQTEIDKFISDSLVLPGEDKLTLKHIMEQKWVSFWMFQSLEAYNDVRRTGYPEMTSGRFPLRIPYPDAERSRNPNVPQNININTIYSIPVWWNQ